MCEGWWEEECSAELDADVALDVRRRYRGVQEWSDAGVHQLPAGVAGRQLRCLHDRPSL